MKFYLSILFLLGINLISFAKPQKLKHVVTITFTANATDAQIKEIDDSFQGLTKLAVVKKTFAQCHIAQARHFERATQISTR